MFRQRRMESKSPAYVCPIPKTMTSVITIVLRRERIKRGHSLPMRKGPTRLRGAAFRHDLRISWSKCFFVYNVWHFGRFAAVVAFKNVNQSLDTSASHSFIGIDIESRDPRAAGEVMEHAAAIRNLGIE